MTLFGATSRGTRLGSPGPRPASEPLASRSLVAAAIAVFTLAACSGSGNSGDPTLAPEARRLLDDPSPLVRGAAVWALSRLLSAEEFDALRLAQCREEADPHVLGEWAAQGP